MRLFLAAEIPDAIGRKLAEVRTDLGRRFPGWRWVGASGIHLTLRFLGETAGDWRDHDAAWRSASASVSAFDVEIGGSGVFPSAARPRVFWVGVREIGSSGRLSALAAVLERAARESGLTPEERPFHPHLTLARWPGAGRRTSPGATDVGVLGVVRIDRVCLFSSELRPTGAVYAELASYPLGGEEHR